jgi:cytosine deaminase
VNAIDLQKKQPDILLSDVVPWPEGPRASVRISGGIITAPQEHPREGERVFHLKDRLLLPGLVNVHCHPDKVGLAERSFNKSGTIDEARQRLREAKNHFTEQDVRERAEKFLRSSVMGGVTALRAHVDIDPVVGLKSVRALLKLREAYKDVLDIQIVAFPQEGILEHKGTEDLLREALRMGADVVGGHLSISRSPQAMKDQLDVVFLLAAEFDRDIDVHTDFGIDFDLAVSRHEDNKLYPDGLGVVHLAEKTIREGYQGRVTASHLCGLDSVPVELRRNVIDLLLKAELSVVALPGSNLYAHGRNDATGSRRGVAPIRELQAAGVPVAVGPDNIRDPFNPYLGADLLLNSLLTAITCHMVTTEDFKTVLEYHTYAPARMMKLPRYGNEPGCDADLVVLEAKSLPDLLDGNRQPLLVLKRGRVVAHSEVTRSFTPQGLKEDLLWFEQS